MSGSSGIPHERRDFHPPQRWERRKSHARREKSCAPRGGVNLLLMFIRLRWNRIIRFGFRVLFLSALAALPLRAQITITFVDGQTSSTTLDTSAPNSPTTLAIASGSATQSGVIS